MSTAAQKLRYLYEKWGSKLPVRADAKESTKFTYGMQGFSNLIFKTCIFLTYFHHCLHLLLQYVIHVECILYI